MIGAIGKAVTTGAKIVKYGVPAVVLVVEGASLIEVWQMKKRISRLEKEYDEDEEE